MGVIGPPIYEWVTHNLFVVVLAIGAIIAMAYFIYAGRKKGRYR